jgi:hypothetical protein
MSFYVHHDGKSWLVHSEVGEGKLTDLVFEEVAPPQPEAEQSLEESA